MTVLGAFLIALAAIAFVAGIIRVAYLFLSDRDNYQ